VIVPGTWNLTEESEHPEALVNRICSFLERAFSCCSLTGVLGATMKIPYNGTSLNVDIAKILIFLRFNALLICYYGGLEDDGIGNLR
ncbi:hypothetical protein SDJN02_07819, partial [Cucurbita argyrosperma subsp. argyrosperma]